MQSVATHISAGNVSREFGEFTVLALLIKAKLENMLIVTKN